MAIATWMMMFTLYPCGQHISWKSWQVFEGAFTPAINSVSETIFLLILKIHDLMMATVGSGGDNTKINFSYFFCFQGG